VTPSQPDPDTPADAPHPATDAPQTASSDDDVVESTPILDRSLDLVRFLRARCEWDAAQTPTSLLPYLLEEAHETADAITAGDDRHLAAELGDLLLNVAFQIVIAEERGTFSAEDVVRGLEAKMRRRHPHLSGDGPRVDWDAAKQAEAEAAAPQSAESAADRAGADRAGAGTGVAGPSAEAAAGRTIAGTRAADASLLDGLAGGLEPLSYAQRMQERVAAVGFDWPDTTGAFEKVVEEAEEVRELLAAEDRAALDDRIEDELGDLLFAVVNLTRLAGAHAMTALIRANGKFAGRFRALEALARERGVVLGEVGLEELDGLWDEVKERARRGARGAAETS
jgi:nucleoside triphosphate diphosphatase